FWFAARRTAIPIYVAGVFPRMLEICGEIADGALLTWCTLDHAREAAHHVVEGARRAGRRDAVDVATLLSCSVASDPGIARDRMRAPVAADAFRVPRYRTLMAAGRFAHEGREVR